MSIRLRTLAILAAIAAALVSAAAVAVLYFGVYNISATEQHTSVVYRLMDYAMRRSIAARTQDLAVPDLAQPARIAAGAAHYRAHCVQCHGAPGVAPEPFARGLMPAPANLVGTAREWQARDMFWVIKHGVKMTGMPSWTGRLADEEIWDLVAFVQASVTMTPRQYAEATRAAPAHVDAARVAPAAPSTGVLGDAEAGKAATLRYLCATCHVIPGVVGAGRHVGPPLSGIAGRSYLGGVLVNTPENMVRWLKNPQQFDPLSAMPPLGLSDQDARDIAAFMYTLDDLSAK